MENATKFLIIAGAILIAIVLISVGMMLVNGAQTTIDEGINQMSQQEKQIFNKQFIAYEGGSVPGSSVNALIDTVVASNNANSSVADKIVSITISSDITSADSDKLIIDSYDGTNTSLVQSFSKAASKLKNAINTGNKYTIEVDTSATTGLVNMINITKNASN